MKIEKIIHIPGRSSDLVKCAYGPSKMKMTFIHSLLFIAFILQGCNGNDSLRLIRLEMRYSGKRDIGVFVFRENGQVSFYGTEDNVTLHRNDNYHATYSLMEMKSELESMPRTTRHSDADLEGLEISVEVVSANDVKHFWIGSGDLKSIRSLIRKSYNFNLAISDARVQLKGTWYSSVIPATDSNVDYVPSAE